MTKRNKRTIENFIKEIDEELSVSFNEGEGYYYETATNIINIDELDNEDCGFMRHLKENHRCNYAEEINLILWSILHEIGHYETENDIEENEEENKIRSALSITEKDFKNDCLIQNLYFNLSSEYYATEWAIEWVYNNFDKAINFSNKLKSILR